MDEKRRSKSLESLCYAWRGSIRLANDLAASVGALLLVGVRYFTGWPSVIPDGPVGLFLGWFFAALAAWAALFLGRLAWAPAHFYFEPRGGFWGFLKGQLKDMFLPVVVLAASQLLLILLFVGGVWRLSSELRHLERTDSGASISRPVGNENVQKRNYSEAEKDELRDAMRDLVKIIDGPGKNAARDVRQVYELWQNVHGAQIGFDPEKVRAALNKVSGDTTALSEALYDDNGLYKRYSSYSDELDSVIGFPSNQSDSPIYYFQIGINHFNDGIRVFEAAATPNRFVADQVAALIDETAVSNLQDAENNFQRWLSDTSQRIDAFRKSLQ